MSCGVYVLRAAPSLPALRRFSYVPRILKFVMPKIIYPPDFSLYFEVEAIRLPPGFEDTANLDLRLDH